VPDDDAPIGDWLSQDPSDPAKVAGRYDEWAETYDADLAAWSYQAPAVVAGTVMTRHPQATSILDVGCGTGLVGQALRAHGFTGRLAGLDLSESSLAVAEQSGAYDALDPADLQQPLPVADDSVDAVVCVGVMTYLPDVEAIWRQLARVTAPGGLVVVTQREDLWSARDCPGVIDRLEAEGVWAALEVSGPAAYLPLGYGGGDAVGCYYLTARIGAPSSGRSTWT
jgi:predicted TPR repeat methyltransferase